MPEAMPMPQKGVNPEKLKKLEEAKKALEDDIKKEQK